MAVSGSGRYVAWTTTATNRGPADTNNDEDAYVYDAQSGTSRLVSHDSSGRAVGGRPTGISDNGKIVALTSPSDALAPDELDSAFVYSAATDRARLISTASPQWPDGVQAATSSISANGRFVAYTAFFPPIGAFEPQVHLYDRQTRRSTQISVRPDGSASNGVSGSPSVSRSGNQVGFCSTATDLVPGDTYGICDLFVWSRTLP